MSELRVFKTDYEIEVMTKASEISSNAHKAVMLEAKPNIYEYELESKFLQVSHKFLKFFEKFVNYFKNIFEIDYFDLTSIMRVTKI